MELDTGACSSVISEDEYLKKFSNVKLEIMSNRLSSVTGQIIEALGKINVRVSFAGMCPMLSLIVIRSNGNAKALLGRNWLDVLFPNWRRNLAGMNCIMSVSSPDDILNFIKVNFPNVLSKGNQSIVGYMAEVVVKEDVSPIFYSAYSVPYKLREVLAEEIDKQVEESTLVPIKFSRWATPIVIVPKPSGKIRICMDCRVTINKCIETEHYPIPNRLPLCIYKYNRITFSKF